MRTPVNDTLFLCAQIEDEHYFIENGLTKEEELEEKVENLRATFGDNIYIFKLVSIDRLKPRS
jgi:hypothetical protein